MKRIKSDLTFYKLIEELKKNKRFFGLREEDNSYFGWHALLILDKNLYSSYINQEDEKAYLSAPSCTMCFSCDDLEANDWQLWDNEDETL